MAKSAVEMIDIPSFVDCSNVAAAIVLSLLTYILFYVNVHALL